jgi:hypothetical protein
MVEIYSSDLDDAGQLSAKKRRRVMIPPRINFKKQLQEIVGKDSFIIELNEIVADATSLFPGDKICLGTMPFSHDGRFPHLWEPLESDLLLLRLEDGQVYNQAQRSATSVY